VSSGPVQPAIESWSLPAYVAHNEAMRQLEEKFLTERDRRYAEVNIEKEKALKIKEEADKAALGLAREIQTYKDEKANELREQIGSERGLYATKDDVAAVAREIRAELKPALDYITGTIGREHGIGLSANVLVTLVFVFGAVIGIVGYFATH
jgi:hypothetical protein